MLKLQHEDFDKKFLREIVYIHSTEVDAPTITKKEILKFKFPSEGLRMSRSLYEFFNKINFPFNANKVLELKKAICRRKHVSKSRIGKVDSCLVVISILINGSHAFTLKLLMNLKQFLQYMFTIS